MSVARLVRGGTAYMGHAVGPCSHEQGYRSASRNCGSELARDMTRIVASKIAPQLIKQSKLRLADDEFFAVLADRGADFFHDLRMLGGDVEFLAHVEREIE